MLSHYDSAHFTTTPAWNAFIKMYALNTLQEKQFEQYISLLIEWNKSFNITAITDVEKIIYDHLYDSLALINDYPLDTCKGLADIGSGGGLPGIPLKIKYPHLPIVLVEVTQKKIHFLNHVITVLDLPLIEVCDLDWRTFVRKDAYTLDVVIARASLRPDELCRMFTDSSAYQQSILVYWASIHWQLQESDRHYFDHEYYYTSGDKERKLVFFKKN